MYDWPLIKYANSQIKDLIISFIQNYTRQTPNLLQDIITVNTNISVYLYIFIFFLIKGFAKSKLLFIYLIRRIGLLYVEHQREMEDQSEIKIIFSLAQINKCSIFKAFIMEIWLSNSDISNVIDECLNWLFIFFQEKCLQTTFYPLICVWFQSQGLGKITALYSEK